MPEWLRLALRALWEGVQAFWRRFNARKADADAGAKHQRTAQEISDAQYAREAEERRDNWRGLSPDALRRRLHDLDDDGA